MAFIPRRKYALAHLDEIRFITGVDDWFAFLDQKDRLLYLMEIAEPWHETLIHRHKQERGVMEWGDLTLLVGSNFYGLWTDRTGQERWICEIVSDMAVEWHVCGGFRYPNASVFHDEHGLEAERIWVRYLQLIEWVRTGLSSR